MSDTATNFEQLAKELAETKGLSLSAEELTALSAALSGDKPAKAAHHNAPVLPPARKRAKNKSGKKEKNPRKGKIGKDGVFEGGKPPVPPNFDPVEIAEKMDLYWIEGDGDKYLVKNEKGSWSKWPKSMVYKKMRSIPGRMITLRPRDGEDNSEADRVLLYTMENRSLTHVFPAMAGFGAGVFRNNGDDFMVMKSARRIEPAEGEWPTVRALIEDRLGVVQSRFFYSWLKKSYESLMLASPGEFQPGQALIFAGGAGSGKSRLQHQIITPLFGGRSADPGPYMFGRTDFNSEMIGAEHLLMEDPQSTTTTKDRVFFGEMIKAIVVNDSHRLHPKGKDAVMAAPFWRLTISINDDPDKMRVLPLITPDIEDKLMIFKVSSAPMPMPASTLEERQAFRNRISEELPAFAWWLLNEWEIPEDIAGDRFGVAHYHDSTLRGDLFEDTPASELLNLIDAAEFSSVDGKGQPLHVEDYPDYLEQYGFEPVHKLSLWDIPKGESNHATTDGLWHERALTLEALLTGEIPGISCSVMTKARSFFRHNNCGRLLSRLRKDSPERIDKRNTAEWKGWAISRPPKV